MLHIYTYIYILYGTTLKNIQTSLNIIIHAMIQAIGGSESVKNLRDSGVQPFDILSNAQAVPKLYLWKRSPPKKKVW